jgi:Limiting CO2-inducible proteins B/C beta carbonyic anhydrases
VKRAAGTLGTIALATSAFPSAAIGAAKKTTTVKSGVLAVQDALANVNPDVVKAVGVFVGGSAVALLGRAVLPRGKGKSKATISKIESVFPGALKNKDLVSKVSSTLNKHGYGKSSLVATSLGADEINRVLEKDFAKAYNHNFHVSKEVQ